MNRRVSVPLVWSLGLFPRSPVFPRVSLSLAEEGSVFDADLFFAATFTALQALNIIVTGKAGRYIG